MSTASAPSEQQEPGPRAEQEPFDPSDAPSSTAQTGGARTGDSAAGALARLEQVGSRPPTRRRPLDIKLLLASMGIAIGLAAVVLGLLSSVTGTAQQNLPATIESIEPVSNATQVPQQTRVFVDLQTGHEGVLIIDGVELPVVSLDDVGKTPPGLGEGGGDQIEIPAGAIFEPGNATLTFEPGTSQPIESFSTGVHTVTVRYWRIEDGPTRFRTFNWTFYAV